MLYKWDEEGIEEREKLGEREMSCVMKTREGQSSADLPVVVEYVDVDVKMRMCL